MSKKIHLPKLNLRKKMTKNLCLAFFLPVVIMVIAYISLGVSPFGENAVMIIDSYHQYVPFFSELHDKIWKGDSLLYSWHGSLGFNFMTVMSYYLASPLNLLIALFPASMMIDAFETLIVLKIALSGVTAYLFLKNRTGRDDLITVLFAQFYALGGFTLAYNWNVMWLDSIVLFPLILWGANRLIDQKDGRLYTVALGLAIFCNYYMAIMICIFLVLYFFAHFFSAKREGVKDFFMTGFRFAGCSLLAGGLGAIYLIPTYFTMMNTDMGYSPSSFKFYRNFLEIFAQTFAFTEPTQLEGPPNIYCGVLIFMLIPIYVVTKKISLREKIAKLLLLAFIFISFNINYLDYVWHGLHFPNNLPGRFSFILILMAVMMAYDAFYWLKSINRGALLVVLGLECLLYGGILYKVGSDMEDYRIGITLGLAAVYMVLLCTYRMNMSLKIGNFRLTPAMIMTLLLTLEVGGNAIYAINMNGTVSYKNYTSDRAEVAEIREDYEAKNSFYRMEIGQTRGRDDITWHHLDGLSYFSSTCDDRMELLTGALGFYNSGNKYTYKGETPLTDAMIGLRYEISNTPITSYNKQLVEETDTKYIYENQRNLALGYRVEDAILDWNIVDGCPFVIQNAFAHLATEVTDNLFTEMSVPEPTVTGGTITGTEENKWNYHRDDAEGELTFQLYFEERQDVYIYFEAAHSKKLSVVIDGKTTNYSDYRGHIVHLGEVDEGTPVTLSFPMSDSYQSGNVLVEMAAFHPEVFEKVYAQLADEQLKVTSFDSTHVKGTIEVAEEGLMMLSIPFDKGWKIRVDGEVTEQIQVGEALTGVRMQPGVHTVDMQYRPLGLVPGALISLVSLIILLL